MEGDQQNEGQAIEQVQEEPQGTDWKAQARKWEERAKANKAKADELAEKASEAAKEADLAKRRTEEQLDEAKAQIARTTALNKVSRKTGVPAHLLHGETVEELTECAEAVKEFAAQSAPGYPTDKGGAAKGSGKVDVSAIKDPAARVMARARNAAN